MIKKIIEAIKRLFGKSNNDKDKKDNKKRPKDNYPMW